MKFARLAVAAAAFAALGLSTGCAMNKPKPAAGANPANPAVTKPFAVTTPPPQPVIVQPVQPVTVEPVVSEAPIKASATSTPAASGTAYTVQKGDTLSKIARAKYGDLTAVRKIKEANPGIDYNNIKTGQRLMLP